MKGGASNGGGTDMSRMVAEPRIAAEIAAGPRRAPSDGDLAKRVSGARTGGAVWASRGAAVARQHR